MVALNADSQSSLFFTGQPQVFTYGDVADASLSLNATTLTPGVETFIDVRGSGAAFDASTTIGFGSADVIVRRQWVLSPDRIVANVITLPGATPGKATLVVTTGLRALTLPDGLQIADPPARLVSVASAVVDDATGRSAISPTFTARVQLKGVADNLTSASFAVRVSGLSAPVVSFRDSFLVFLIPAGLAPGPALTEITAAGEALPSVLTPIDLPPPVITGASSGTSAQPAVPGDIITFHVRGLTEKPMAVDPQSLVLLVGGVATNVVQSSLSVPGPGNDIQIVLDPKQASGVTTVIVSLDGRASPPFTLFVK